MIDTRTLLLSQSDVARCLKMGEVVDIVERTFRAHGEGRVVMPPKVNLDLSSMGLKHGINALPAFVQGGAVYGIKWVGGFWENPQRFQLPYLMAVLVLNDLRSGVPLAIMDATRITAMRTGAAAAVAAKHLAAPGARVAAIVGCGVQGLASLEALRVACPLQEIRAADARAEAREALAARARELGLRAVAAETIRAAVEGADIIVTATTADEPLVRREWVKPGAVVAKLGSFQELDDALTLGADKLVVDHREQNQHRGELAHLFRTGRLTQAGVHAQLGEIVAGSRPGREDAAETIVATLIGMGAEDVAVGEAVLQRARETGLGQRFDFLA